MFKTWLYANIEFAYLFFALILLGIAAIFLPVTDTNGEYAPWGLALLAIGAVSCVLLFACEPRFGPVLSVLALVGLYIFFVSALKDPNEGKEIPERFIRISNTLAITLSVISAVPAFFVARYVHRNFDDVVSLRWLYRNSAKDVFVTTWKYTFNRFCMTFLVVLCLLIDIAVIIVLIVAEHNGEFASLVHKYF